MPSMSAVFDGKLYDGRSARAQTVRVRALSDAIEIEAEAREPIGFDLLRRENHAASFTLHRSDQPDWRLTLPPEAAAEFMSVQKLHAVTARHWGWIGGSVAAAAIIGAAIWMFGNAMLAAAAPLVPRAVSESVGKQYAGFLIGEDGACTTPEGEAALKAMIARITPPAGFVEPVRVRVTKSKQINAVTLPGGEVLVFDGLIQAAQSPEELAGVIAHEFGHVQHYHSNQALIRHFGMGVFLEGLGGNMGTLASTGLFLSNSRTAEREADEEAIALMTSGAVSPLGLSAFFERMGGRAAREEAKAAKGEDGIDGWTSLLQTHPGDDDRRTRFAAAAKGLQVKPVLDDARWQALRGMCAATVEDKATDR